MEITGPGGIGGTPKVHPDRKPARIPSREGSGGGGDKVEISDVARLKGIFAALPSVRPEKAARIQELRQMIRDGGYPPDGLVDKALDLMIDEETGA